MPIFVKFWGTRGLIPTPGNATRVYGSNTPCVEVRADDTVFICDAGSGLRDFGKDLLARQPLPGTINIGITHLHYDHVQGLPFAPIYFHGMKVRVFGPGAADGGLQKILAGRSGVEPVAASNGDAMIFEELRPVSINGLQVKTVRLNHPGGCTGLILEKDGKKIVYAPDNELPLNTGEIFPDPEHRGSLRQMPPALVEAFRNADLLILDGQYDDEQYGKRKGWGHSSCFSAVDLAIQAGVKNLALFHHDPESNDQEVDAKIQACYARADKHKATNLTIFGAREGMELKF